MTALRNYTGDLCFPRGAHPPAREHNADFQLFVTCTSDDAGATWGVPRVVPMNQVCWNMQLVYVSGAVILHAKLKAKQQSGQLFQLASRDVPRRLCV